MSIHKTDEDLEAAARHFLKSVGLEYQVCPDLMTIISKVKAKDASFDYRRVPDIEMIDCEAQWDSVSRRLRMRESVFQSMQKNEARARMTVAHELMHYILGHSGVRNRSVDRSFAELKVSHIRREESEARRGGPVLLAPEYLVPDPVKVETLIDRFGLSQQAALYRKEEIEGVRRRARDELRPLPNVVKDLLREARRRGVQLQTDIGEN